MASELSVNPELITEAEGAKQASEAGMVASGSREGSFNALSTPGQAVEVVRMPVLWKTLVSLFALAVMVWVVLAWQRHRADYVPARTARKLGERAAVELTLVREDKGNLQCASSEAFGGLHCEKKSSAVSWPAGELDDKLLLRPYSTVDNEHILAAGLWSQLPPLDKLPTSRFTVVCNFTLTGLVKNVDIRWNTRDSFGRPSKSMMMGVLTDCVLPQ